MKSLWINTIGTEVVLLIAFFVLYLSSKKNKNNIIIQLIFLLIGGIPLLYAAIDHVIQNYPDANIGLGIGFYYTWLYTIVVLFIGIIKLIIRGIKKSLSNK